MLSFFFRMFSQKFSQILLSKLFSVHIVSSGFARLAMFFHNMVCFGVSGTMCERVLVVCELTV